MNRHAALDILQLPQDAGIDAIDAQFRQLFNNYQVKITNAPSGKLKATFTENLERLNEAYRTLKEPNSSGTTPSYPTTEPSTVVAPLATTINTSIDNNRPSLPFTEEEYKGVKKWRNVFLLTSIFAFTLAGLFLAKWFEGGKTLTKQEDLIADYKKGMKNIPFKIMNSSDETIEIVKFKVFCFNETEKRIIEFEKTYPNKEWRKLVSSDSYKPKIDDEYIAAFAYYIVYADSKGPMALTGQLNDENPIAKLTTKSE